MTPPAPTSSASSTSPRAHEGRDTIFDVVARTAEHCFMPVTVGGGIRKLEDIRKLLLSGADKVSINTAAVNDPDFVARAADKFGDQCIVVSVDARQRRTQARRWRQRHRVGDLHPWRTQPRPGSMRSSSRRAWSSAGPGSCSSPRWIATARSPASTSQLTRAIADAVHVPVIASGGVGTLDHLVDGVKEGHASAVLAASIFHFGTFTIARGQGASATTRHRHAQRRRGTLDDLHPRTARRARAERATASPDESYTAKLLAPGVETLRAEVRRGGGRGRRSPRSVGDKGELIGEAADVLYPSARAAPRLRT